MNRIPLPTPRGWTLLLGGAGLLIAGASFGFVDLMRTGTFALILTLLMWLLVLVALPQRLRISRSMHPRPPRVGQRTDVTVTMDSSRSSLLPATLREHGTVGSHTWNVRHVDAGTTHYTYSHTPTSRGVWDTGRLRLSLRDPLGLMHVDSAHGSPDSWLVWPEVDVLGGRAPSQVGDGDEALPRLNALNAGVPGAGIREYAQGDDMRLVHWAATAHRGELMVRQLEPPARPALVLALTGSVAGYGQDAAFEWLVRALASTASHLADERVDFEAHIGSDITRDRDATLNVLAQITDSSMAEGLPRDRAALAFVHSSSTRLSPPPRQYPALALVAGPDAQQAAASVREQGWDAIVISAQDVDGASTTRVMNRVLAAMGGQR